ncbi:hypothetical protein AWP48_04375 [Escherichia coli]|nr:hypothetical protein AWP48_04375 [Escherichia coli]
MDSVHHIWCPLFSQEFQDLPDGAETTLTIINDEIISDMILCKLLNYHIICPFPAVQIRFPAKSDRPNLCF